MKYHVVFLGRPNQLIPRRNERSNAPSFLPLSLSLSFFLSLSLLFSLSFNCRKEGAKASHPTRRPDGPTDGRATYEYDGGVGRTRFPLVGLIQLLYSGFEWLQGHLVA